MLKLQIMAGFAMLYFINELEVRVRWRRFHERFRADCEAREEEWSRRTCKEGCVRIWGERSCRSR